MGNHSSFHPNSQPFFLNPKFNPSNLPISPLVSLESLAKSSMSTVLIMAIFVICRRMILFKLLGKLSYPGDQKFPYICKFSNFLKKKKNKQTKQNKRKKEKKRLKNK